jgi:hypothetical protein
VSASESESAPKWAQQILSELAEIKKRLDSPAPDWLSIRDCCDKSQRSESHVRRAIKRWQNGDPTGLRHVNDGNEVKPCYRIRPEWLTAWMEQGASNV